MMKPFAMDLGSSVNFYHIYESAKNIIYWKWAPRIASLKLLNFFFVCVLKNILK